MTSDQGLRTILIRLPNWVGDAVMAVPALREFRRIFKDARIALAAKPWVAGLFDGEDFADELIAVTDARGFVQKARRFIGNARRLRHLRIDMAVLLPNSFNAAISARAGGAKRIAGYATDGRRSLLTHIIPFESSYKQLHQVRYYLNIAAQLEQQLTGQSSVNLEAKPVLHAADSMRQRAVEIMAAAGINPAKRIIALNPGATNSRAKQWLPERFAATADRLSEREGFETIIVGTAGDCDVARAVSQQMRTKVADLTGGTSLAELKAVLSCAALVISNDTGTAHVAAALGVPTVTVFGPTEDFATRPLAERATVVRHPVDCSPCMLRDCPIDHRCMTRVEVADVENEARQLLVAISR
jgi:heptosyltransferase II